jgi:hypothetical protein
MAAGAGVDVDSLFLWNCRGDLRLPEGATAAAAEGCTTVLLPADPEAGRAAVIGHNEDGAADLAGHCFLAAVAPTDGVAFTSFCYPGMLPGHAFAVNAAGLVHAVDNVRPHDLRVGVPRHFVARAVLDCENLDAALAVLRRPDRASGFHHGLARAGDPRLLSVEAPASGCHVRQVNRPAAHANHLIAERFADLPQVVTASSAARQWRAETLLSQGATADGDPRAVLFDRADRDLPIHRGGDAGDDDGRTLATAVFRVGAERVDWAVYGDADGSPEHEGTVRPAT